MSVKANVAATEGQSSEIHTPLGDLVIYPSTDPKHPGVYIDLKRDGCRVAAPIAMVEYSNDDVDIKGEHIITRTWDDCNKEDYSSRVVHHGIDKFFKEDM